MKGQAAAIGTVSALARRPLLLLAVAAVAALLALSPWGRQLDLIVYDSMFQVRGEQPLPDEILMVAIDELSFQALNQRWPWPRRVIAEAIERMAAGGARVIAVDLLFPEPSDEADDQALARAMRAHGGTILAVDRSVADYSRFVVETFVQPMTLFAATAARVGHITAPTDRDGFLRRTTLVANGVPSLALAAAQTFSGGECCAPPRDKPLHINYAGGSRSIRTVSFYQVLDQDRYPLPADIFRDKVVFLGINTQSSVNPEQRTPDHFPTPFTRWRGGYTAGSVVHANIVANLLNDNFLRVPPYVLVVLGGLLLAALYAGVTNRLSFRANTIAIAGAIVLVGALAVGLFTLGATYLSPFALLLPALSVYLISPYYQYLTEARQRAQIVQAFSTYVNPSIVAEIENDPEALKLGGKQVEGTALFLDLAGFTGMSERHEPEAMVDFINEFLSAMIDIAMEEGGTVERFLGDAVMVIWGAPTAQPDHARRACRAALAMAERIRTISKQEAARMGTPISARIGINSGSMIAGNIGANRRFNYTVLGDCVNLAARLEGVNKLYDTTILIGSATEAALDEGIERRFIDTVRVKGRGEPERIYELMGLRGTLPQARLEAARCYARAHSHYRERQWERARELFEQCAQLDNNDAASRAMAGRCKRFVSRPPGEDWDGVFDIDTK